MIHRQRRTRLHKINSADWAWQALVIDALSLVISAATIALIINTLT